MKTRILEKLVRGLKNAGKAISYIFSARKRKVWHRSFKLWQRRPHQVAPLKNVHRKCASCGTEYVGNYCPRCGQSATIGRFSFSNALLLFLDVWGVGNRSMFRSIRDMVLRPGYMIRDYLRGMQSAYFPPFEMFFLLATFSLLVEHGFTFTESEEKEGDKSGVEWSVESIDSLAQQEGKQPYLLDFSTGGLEDRKAKASESKDETTLSLNLGNEEEQSSNSNGKIDKQLLLRLQHYVKLFVDLCEYNPAVSSLIALILGLLPMFFFLRNTPNIAKMRFSEFIVASVYTSNTFSIFYILATLLDSGLLKLIAFLMIFITLKQLTGYSKRRVFGYLLLTCVISVILLTIVITIGIYALMRT